MDRRDFLKISGFATAGLFVASSAIKSLAKGIQDDTQFSIEAFVSNSDKAVELIERFIKKNIQTKYTIKYSEYSYSSAAVGDIVFILNNNLVDIVNPKNNVAGELSEIRKSLLLPGYIETPVRIRIYTENSSPLSRVFVARKGRIISDISLNKNKEYTYTGKSGKLVLTASDNTFAVTESECKHQICKRMGKIEKAGDYIACIPNDLQIFSE